MIINRLSIDIPAGQRRGGSMNVRSRKSLITGNAIRLPQN